MISDNIFPQRFTKVDDLTRGDHYYLTDGDSCYFIGEYTTSGGYEHSHTNNLIFNFKKSLDRRGHPEWKYKGKAIQQAAEAIRTALGASELNSLTFVPIPPSKMKDDPLYDDRVTQMLNSIRPEPPLDIREIIVQTESVCASHETDNRSGPSTIQAQYRIDEDLVAPSPERIALVDDVLTTGAHFRAAKLALAAHFPDTTIVGLFIARRAIEIPPE